jgi:signal transduction histidine kinase
MVEDDQALLRAVSDLLELSGYKVYRANDGTVALRLLETLPQKPDIIVSDIGMPNMDGYQLLSTVRSRQEWVSIPFIFLTAKGEKEDIREGKLRGADDYVTKPFEFPDLLASIQGALLRREELKSLQASELLNMRQQILNVLNHEFRTPLSYIVAYADLMANSPSFEHSDDLRQYINGILQGSERLSRLIETFLILAELESTNSEKLFEARKMRIDNLVEMFNRLVAAAQTLAQTSGISLRLMSEPDLPPIVGDLNYLEITFKHLIDNAIKFSPEGKKAVVSISIHANASLLSIAICDQGRGIPISEHDKLFESFYQVNREVYEQQGLGAGLAIVRRVIELHGGEIVLESEPGQGTCFVVQLPIDPTASTVSPPHTV